MHESIPFILATAKQAASLPYVAYDDNIPYSLDMTDFLSSMTPEKDYDFYLCVQVQSGSSAGNATVDDFTISEYSNGYGNPPTDSRDGTKDGSQSKATYKKPSDFPVPVVRALPERESFFTAREMTEDEKRTLNNTLPDTPLVIDGHGTGLVKAKDLTAYDGFLVVESTMNDTQGKVALSSLATPKVDLSAPMDGKTYFPPACDQNKTSACGAFASVYYIMTYEMAREHGWDLNGVTFNTEGETVTWGPSNQEHVMSPAFLYHLVNGGSQGTNGTNNLEMLGNLGCCTWGKSEKLLFRFMFRKGTDVEIIYDLSRKEIQVLKTVI